MNQGLIERAMERLGRDREPIFRLVAECDGGEWYLKEKIVEAPDDASLLDNTRPLKYAYNFVIGGAKVRFVRETSAPTPDLAVTAPGSSFFVEVKKFRMPENDPSSHPVEKIVTAVERGKLQLPPAGVGFVAIDNFDVHLEPAFRYDVIVEALCETARRAVVNPDGWRVPSGVIVAASTSMGSALPVKLPHFVWTNPSADPASPASLTNWIVSALPDGRAFNCPEAEVGGSDEVEHQALVETLEF